MTFDAFEEHARRAFDRIPERYREGVDGLVVERDSKPHPDFPCVYTMGLCDTETYPSGWDGPDTVRSRVVLYWGSFRALAELDPRFDWEEETWETLTHELYHHLEWLAGEDDLCGVDYAMDQTFQRDHERDFDLEYYRSGERIGPGVYNVEGDVYVEQTWRPDDLARADELRFAWAGREFSVEPPSVLGDVHFVRIVEGVPDPPRRLELALVSRPSWLERLRGLVRRREPEIWESEARPSRSWRPDGLGEAAGASGQGSST